MSSLRDIHGIAALRFLLFSANCYPESIFCQDRGRGCVLSGDRLGTITDWISRMISSGETTIRTLSRLPGPSARGMSGWVACCPHWRRSQTARSARSCRADNNAAGDESRSRRSWVATESQCCSRDEHSVNAVDPLFIMIVAMGERHQSVPAHPHQFERLTAAGRILAADKKIDHGWCESDDYSEG